LLLPPGFGLYSRARPNNDGQCGNNRLSHHRGTVHSTAGTSGDPFNSGDEKYGLSRWFVDVSKKTVVVKGAVGIKRRY
jgi:hypothetical protein